MSTSEGSGTTVTVRLKAAPADASGSRPTTTAPTTKPDLSLSSIRVLVIDDDESTRFVLARFFDGAAAVATADGGAEGLLKVEGFAPHVVVIDAEMPGLDGFATARRLRELETRPGVPRRLLIGLSSHDDLESRRGFQDAGCDLVLVKPVSRPALVAAVTGAIAAASRPAVQSLSDAVVVDAELMPLIPAFLDSRRDQARELETALAARDLEGVRRIAHKLRGGLEMCGFAAAGEMSRVIEEGAADPERLDELRERATLLRAYLERVQYKAG